MSSQQRANEGHYFIVVDGVPPYCQWQELKDYLRESVKVNPAGYADVLRVNEDGTRVGYCGLRSKADANKAFDFLIAEGWRGLNIRVSIIWKSDLRSDVIERRRGPGLSIRKRSIGTTAALPSFPNNATCSTRTAPKPGSSAHNFNSLRQVLPRQPPMIRHMQPSYEPCQPCGTSFQATTNASSYPQAAFKSRESISNTSSNASISSGPLIQSCLLLNREDRIYTDQLAIHMSRLPYDVKASDLRALLSRFGKVSDISIRRAKEKRCSATAKFGSSSEAMHAIQGLNGKLWDKLNLIVRFDRSEVGSVSSAPSTTSKGFDDSDSSSPRLATAKSPSPRQGPLVVDGSCGPSYHRRKACAEDSEGKANSSDEEDALVSRKTAVHKSTSRNASVKVISR